MNEGAAPPRSLTDDNSSIFSVTWMSVPSVMACNQ